MNNIEDSKKVFGLVKDLSQIETNELELMLAIFKKTLNSAVAPHVEILTNEFENACAAYGKNPDELGDLRDELVGGYEKEFYKIKERIEEQYVNLIFELQETQSNEKIAITNYMKMAGSDYTSSEDAEKMDALISRYGDYCGLEEECQKMLDECAASVPYLLETVMKFEGREVIVKSNSGLLESIKKLLSSIFKTNKFETNFVDVKRAKLAMVVDNTETVAEEIRDNTVNYIDTLASYKDQIKEATNVIA